MHPAVTIIKDEIKSLGIAYSEISARTGIPENRIKNLMTGRTAMSLEVRDALCTAIGLSPVNVVLRRHDITANEEFLDLRWMPEDLRTSLSVFCKLMKLKNPKK